MKELGDEVLQPEGLEGDGPGADPVMLIVDGRSLKMPRSLLVNLATYAYNRAGETQTQYVEDLLSNNEGRRHNAKVSVDFLKSLVDACWRVGEFARSK